MNRFTIYLAHLRLSEKALFALLSRADRVALAAMSVGILFFARRYIDPTTQGFPLGLDIGDDLAYAGTLRSELLSGRLLTWWSVAHDGIPLIGHPNTQFFYLPFTVPVVALGTAAGARVAFVGSLLLAGFGMYFLARLLGPRPFVAAWVGVMFAIGGGMVSRIFAGHLQKVLALPLVPLVLGGALMIGRSNNRQDLVFWSVATGLIHGLTFLAGESFIQIFLFVAVPMIVVIVSRGEAGLSWGSHVIWGLTAWGAGLAMATAGKLIAALPVLAETVRSVDPYAGSEHSYRALVHLAIPPVSDLFQDTIWGWWEYSQYIGIVPVILAGVAVCAVALQVNRRASVLGSSARTRELLALLAVILLGVLWLANASWYSPVHWLYSAVPNLQDFRVPSRALMLTSPAILALAAVGMETVLGSSRLRTPGLAILLGAASLIAIWLLKSWAYEGIPGIQGLATQGVWLVIVLVAAAVLFAAAAWFIAFWWTDPRRRFVLPVVVTLVAIAALADVFHTTQGAASVGYTPSSPDIRRVIGALEDRDKGPFLVFLGDFGVFNQTSVRLEFAERGISVASPVSPLAPEHLGQHNLIGREQRYRYIVSPSNQSPVGLGSWEPVAQSGEVSAFVNTQADGDVWLITDGEIQPLKVVDTRPGRFLVHASAERASTLVIPANAFSGWRVSIDGASEFAASEFEGYVAVQTQPGEHRYDFKYKTPLLPLVLFLGAIPWVAIGGLTIWGFLMPVRKETAS